MKGTPQTTPATKKKPRRAKAEGPAAGIREAEQARVLLQDQLHRLYWWVFNACRIKGFLRAKQLDETDAGSEELSEEPRTGRSEPVASANYPATERK